MGKLTSQYTDKDMSYQLVTVKGKQTNLGKINLIYCKLKIEQDGEKQRQKLNHFLFPDPSTPLFVSLNFFPSSSIYSSVKQHSGIRIEG